MLRRYCIDSIGCRMRCSVRSLHKQYTNTSPVFELRTYDIHPADYPKFIKVTNELIHIRTNFSPVLGYWMTEIGGINQVVHIWEYESLAERARVRQKLASDVDFNSRYLDVVRPMWAKQTNSLMLSVSRIQRPTQPGVYELRTFHTDPELDELTFASFSPENITKSKKGNFVGAWKTVVGERPSHVQLWHYKDIDEVYKNQSNQIVEQDFKKIHSVTSKILIPTPFSPLK